MSLVQLHFLIKCKRFIPLLKFLWEFHIVNPLPPSAGCGRGLSESELHNTVYSGITHLFFFGDDVDMVSKFTLDGPAHHA